MPLSDDPTETDTPTPLPPAPLARASHPAPLAGRGGIWRVFNALYDKYVPFVRRFLTRRRDLTPESVEDLIQTSFTTLSHQMEDEKLPIRNPEALIVTIVGHEVANHTRRGRLPIVVGAETLDIPDNQPDPERTAELHERIRKLEGHLKAMERDKAELIQCIDVYEWTYEQTSKALGRPLSTVAKEYHRARATLDERIHAAGESAAPSERGVPAVSAAAPATTSDRPPAAIRPRARPPAR